MEAEVVDKDLSRPSEVKTETKRVLDKMRRLTRDDSDFSQGDIFIRKGGEAEKNDYWEKQKPRICYGKKGINIAAKY
ncbi:hypothetical protein AgCh_017561 [Apium graveolens]